MVITFDFDDTLLWTAVDRDEDGSYVEHNPIGQNPYVFPRLLEALDSGNEVHIVTSRRSRTRPEVLAWLEEWGVLDRLAGVHFTEGALKHDTLERLGSRQHFDDDPEELAHLPEGCRGVRAPLHPSWTGQLGEGRYIESSRSDEMRRLRLVGQNERLLRETVRGMLEGIADAGPAESERVRQSFDQEDSVLSALGITSDVAGVVLNRFEATWWGKPVNILADSFSLMFATMQLSRAAARYREVYVDTDLSSLSQDQVDDVLFVYQFDYMVSKCMWVLSLAGFAASVAQVAGWEPGTGFEVLVKGIKWGMFGVSIVDSTSGSGSSILAVSKRLDEISRWVNGPQFAALTDAVKSATAMMRTKEGQVSIAAASAKLAMGGLVPQDTLKKCLDEVMPEQQRTELLDWLSTIKVKAADRAK
jgi:hypothetical protein